MGRSRTIWVVLLLACTQCGDGQPQQPPCDDGRCTGTAGSTSTGSELESVGAESSDPATTTDGVAADSTTGEGTTSSEGSSSTGSDTGSSTGEPVTCGNGALDPGEECDDGDAEDGNGCDNDCTSSVVVELAAGSSHTCALLDTGVARCWGANYLGALGLGHVDVVGDDEPPSSGAAAGVGVDIVALSAGFGFTCAITTDEAVRCWGRNNMGQLGYGDIIDIGDDELPSRAGDNSLPAGAITSMSTGSQHTCAAYSTGEVACWGVSSFGQLGYGSYDTIGDDEPVADAGFVDVPGNVVQLAAGERHTCALLDTGAVRCWGYGLDGALGYGNQTWIGDNELPSSVGEVQVPAAEAIVAGDNHTCILTTDGLVWCWGAQLGVGLGYLYGPAPLGDNEPPPGPVMVVEEMLGESVTQIVAGSRHTCALVSGGAVRCWGAGSFGRLGYGDTQNVGDDESPYSRGDVDVGGPVAQLTAGHTHTCALLQSGSVRCWGSGLDGRLGYGNTEAIGDDEPPSAAGDVPLF